jgi:hypothetical protein
MRFVFDPENYSQVGWAFINDATHADLDAFLARQGWGQPVLPQQPIIVSPQPVIVNPMPQQPVVVAPVPGYNGPIGCNMPMSQPDFEQLRRSIQSKGFESTKLDFAKTVTSKNCLTSAQVRSVVELFDFESSKLEYAKFAYGFVYDINNYFTVSEAFGFDSSTTDLMRHIERNRRN